MAEPARSEPAETEDADLALDPEHTRFLDAETERRYRAWSFERAIPGARIGLRVANTVWIVALLALAIADRDGIAPWIAAISVIVIANEGVRIALRRNAPRLVDATLAFALATSGTVGVALGNVRLGSVGLGVAATIWGCFFQLRATIVRPEVLAPSVAPYVLFELGVLAHAVTTGAIGLEAAGVSALLVVGACAIGMQGAVRSAAAKRRSYRQQRIIERQTERLARERARTEEMLARELKHQVAERSRELGAVLARADVSLDARRLEPGQRFAERYKVVSLLGAGGMGVVYEVERVTDGQRLALKAVVGEVSGASAARFAREAEIGARVHHAHIVSIVDVGVSAGVPFLVMELVTGGSLEAQRARFGDVAWALPILRQIGEGLAALHDAGAVHRDLKPANVLLSGDPTAPRAKISDFGISRFGAPDEPASIDPSAPTIGASPSPRAGVLTGTGVILGTPLYMAPEAARGGRTLGAAADVFALGVMAYELLSGRAPFSVPAPMLVMAGQPIPSPPPLDATGAPPRALELVRRSLAAEPSERPRTRELLDALR